MRTCMTRVARIVVLAVTLVLLVGCEDHRARPAATATATGIAVAPGAGVTTVAGTAPSPTRSPNLAPAQIGAPPPIVRQVISIVEGADQAAFKALIETRPEPCAPPNGDGAQQCGPGEPLGTLYDSFSFGRFCNGFTVGRETAIQWSLPLLNGEAKAILAARNGDPDTDSRRNYQYVVVFATSSAVGPSSSDRDDYFGAYLSETGIVHITIGCNRPDDLTKGARGTFGARFDLAR